MTELKYKLDEASATTGKTILKTAQILGYYGATISGISAVFSSANSVMGIPINLLIFRITKHMRRKTAHFVKKVLA